MSHGVCQYSLSTHQFPLSLCQAGEDLYTKDQKGIYFSESADPRMPTKATVLVGACLAPGAGWGWMEETTVFGSTA